jgi:hypothetical protein
MYGNSMPSLSAASKMHSSSETLTSFSPSGVINVTWYEAAVTVVLARRVLLRMLLDKASFVEEGFKLETKNAHREATPMLGTAIAPNAKVAISSMYCRSTSRTHKKKKRKN